MQKLDLRNHLHELIIGLKSKEIVDMFNLTLIPGKKIMQLIFDSKAAFDRATVEKEKLDIFDQFMLKEVYSTEFFARLMPDVVNLSSPDTRQRSEFMSKDSISTFISNHKTLIATFKIVDNLLLDNIEVFNEENSFSSSTALNNGILLLQIIDEADIPLSKVNSVLEHLEKLIETVYLLFDKIEKDVFEDAPVITMADSGSDLIFSVKLPKKAANLIAQIIKQFWDVVVNNKSFRHSQKLKDVEEYLTVMAKIEEARIQGSIEPEMAQILKQQLFINTKNIILQNALTKEIVIETKELSNRELLLEQTKVFRLESGEEKESEEPKSEI